MKFKKLSHVLIFCLGIMLMSFALGKGISFLGNKFFPDVLTTIPCLFVTINDLIGSFIGILILKKLGKINILKEKGKGFWYGIFLGSIMLLPNMYSGFIQMAYILGKEPALRPISAIITIILMFLAVGLYEELLFRGIILGVMEDYFGHKSASAVWKTVILSGLCFGIFHLGNLSYGENFENFQFVLKQVINSAGVGMFWGAVYMRSRNLYSLMFLHAVNDILAAALWLSIAGNSLSSVLSSSSEIDFMGTFVFSIVYVLLTMFLLRKKKMREIIDSNKLKPSFEY